MNQKAVPLLSHRCAESIVAYRGAESISARRFLADVAQLSAVLPGAQHVLNACTDRYRFAVGLGACLVSGRTSLLPPTQTPEVLRHLRAFARDAVCLTDTAAPDIGLPVVRFPSSASPLDHPWRVPMIPRDQRAAFVFTSGSTGTPVPHAKAWGGLTDSVRVEACRLGLGGAQPWVVLATVPPQHMYGFESSVLLALQSGIAFAAERPFYPADIARVLEAMPRPRLLVTTPVHLRALLAADLLLPAADLVVSATAPLDSVVAAQVEARFGAPVLEIYGSTETGQIASRRTVDCREWQLWPGVEMNARDGRNWVQGGHVVTATPMADMLEARPNGRFVLNGRTADLVNIAGKRSSLAYLNHQLNAIPGVVDGAFFVPDEPADGSATGVGRLGAVVVAPGLTAAVITRQLRERVDPVFIPRPLLLVDGLPRNSTGKLPQSALKALAART